MHLVSKPRIALTRRAQAPQATSPCTDRWTAASLLTLALCLAPLQKATAQSICASDGRPEPVLLVERFINADCETCWQDRATPEPGNAHAVLDWIVPNDAGGKADDAPLSAVASRDGLARLDAIGKGVPQDTLNSTHTIVGIKDSNGTTLRVAHGLPLSGYLGASIELKPIPPAATKQLWTAWLALVETLPAGTEGTPVARYLVRNAFQVTWNGDPKQADASKNQFFDARSMSIAQGVNPDRLRVVGWVEDATGQVLAAAQSRCVGD